MYYILYIYYVCLDSVWENGTDIFKHTCMYILHTYILVHIIHQREQICMMKDVSPSRIKCQPGAWELTTWVSGMQLSLLDGDSVVSCFIHFSFISLLCQSVLYSLDPSLYSLMHSDCAALFNSNPLLEEGFYSFMTPLGIKEVGLWWGEWMFLVSSKWTFFW